MADVKEMLGGLRQAFCGSLTIPAPIGLLAELTHRCPLQCPYCSNPVELTANRANSIRKHGTACSARRRAWACSRCISRAASRRPGPILPKSSPIAGRKPVYQSHHVGRAAQRKGFAGTIRRRLDHVQVSFQDVEAANADRIGGYKGGHEKKLRLAGTGGDPRAAAHGQCGNPPAEYRQHRDVRGIRREACAKRIEIAHTQYYGWALANRDALMPTYQQALDAVKLLRNCAGAMTASS